MRDMMTTARNALCGLALVFMATPAVAEDAPTTVSHGISAFGALKYPPDFKAFDYVYLDAPRTGGIRLGSSYAPTTFSSFNPFIPFGDPAVESGLYLYDSLMVRALDEPDAVYGLVAKSVEMPADRSFAIFNMRPEARFSDGSPLTAEDVAWTVETLRTKGSPFYGAALKDVTKVTVLEPHKIRFDFDPKAGTRDLAAFVGGLPILSKASWAGRDFSTPSMDKPVGSGPYKIGDFRQGKEVTYVRREDYWAKDLPVRRGHYNFDEITIVYARDRDVFLQEFFAGDTDFREEFSSKNWATSYDQPPVEKGQIKRLVLADGRPGGAQGWYFNTRRAKFSDPRVRQAIASIFNFEKANEELFYRLYNRTISPFMNSDLVAEGRPSGEEMPLLEPFRNTVPKTVFGRPVTPPKIGLSNARQLRARRRAIKLFAEAGWTIDESDGLMKNAKGEVFEFEFLMVTGSTFDRIVAPFIDDLSKMGVRAKMKMVDGAVYLQRQRALEFDVISARNVFEATPGKAVRSVFHSETAEKNDTNNLAGVKSPAIDALILKMEQATTRETFVTAARALDRVFRAGHYWTPHWYKASHTVAYWDRFGRPADKGIEKPPFGRAVLETWWVDPGKAAKLKSVLGR